MKDLGRTNNSIKNVITAMIVQVLTVAIGVVSRTVFMRTLGEDYLGINGLFTSALTILALSEFGVGDAIVYRLIYLFAEKNNSDIKSVFIFSKKLYRLLIVVTIVMGIAISPVVFSTVKLETPIQNLTIYYYIFVVNIALTYLSSPYSQVFKASQKERITVRGTFISQTIIYLLQIVSLLVYKRYIIYLGLMLFQNVIMYIYYRRIFQKYYCYLEKLPYIDISQQEKRNIVNITKDMFVGKMAAASIASVDNLTISYFDSTTLVGRYSNYVLVFDVVKRIAKIVYNAIYSSIGEINVSKDKKTKMIFYKIESYLFFYIGTILVTGACIFANPLIYLWLGEKYMLDQKIVIIACVDIYLGLMTYGMENFANTSELYKKTKKSYLKMAATNCFLSIVLGYFYGMFGVLLATPISRIIYYIEVPRLVFEELFSCSALEYYKDLMSKVSITGLNILLGFIIVRKMGLSICLTSFIIEVVVVAVNSILVLEVLSINNKEHEFIVKRSLLIIKEKLYEFNGKPNKEN